MSIETKDRQATRTYTAHRSSRLRVAARATTAVRTTASDRPGALTTAVTGAHSTRWPTGGRSTLEEMILGVWEDLSDGRLVECPVCGGPLKAHSYCTDCGSQLS